MLGEVLEVWVGLRDQASFLLRVQPLSCFSLAIASVIVWKGFGVQETVACLLFCKAFVCAALVLDDPAWEIAGDSDVEGAGGAAEDVNVAGWKHAEIVAGRAFAGEWFGLLELGPRFFGVLRLRCASLRMTCCFGDTYKLQKGRLNEREVY